MKLNVCYSTLFDILLLHLISFIVSFCYYLSNKEAFVEYTGMGRLSNDVGTCRMGVVFHIACFDKIRAGANYLKKPMRKKL